MGVNHFNTSLLAPEKLSLTNCYPPTYKGNIYSILTLARWSEPLKLVGWFPFEMHCTFSRYRKAYRKCEVKDTSMEVWHKLGTVAITLHEHPNTSSSCNNRIHKKHQQYQICVLLLRQAFVLPNLSIIWGDTINIIGTHTLLGVSECKCMGWVL